MIAIVNKAYGPPEVLQPEEVEKPAPENNEILIKIHATTVTAADYRMRSFRVSPGLWIPARLAMGLKKPKKNILGTEVSGTVEAIGKDVNLFNVGDAVFGIDSNVLGAYAEYVCRSENSALATKPEGMTFKKAAAVPFGALTALFFLRDKGGIKNGNKVLIYGASGGVGTFSVQLAKYFGAEVTGVCSTANLEMVQSLGADHMIDYTKEDISQKTDAYDIIFDTVGKTRFSGIKHLLRPNGKYLLTVFDIPQIFQMLKTSIFGGKKVICAIAPERKKDLLFIKTLLEEGKIKPVIDRTYPMDRIQEAHHYADAGHKKGSIVIQGLT